MLTADTASEAKNSSVAYHALQNKKWSTGSHDLGLTQNTKALRGEDACEEGIPPPETLITSRLNIMYRGTSFMIRKRTPLGTYRRPVPKVQRES